MVVYSNGMWPRNTGMNKAGRTMSLLLSLAEKMSGVQSQC